MGLKKDLEIVKNEFKSDEKIFESAFRVERFFKKYKKILLVLLGILIAAVVYWQVSSILEENRAQKSSEYARELQKQPKNQALRDKLKQSSPLLYEIFLLKEALRSGSQEDLSHLAKSKNPLIAQIAKYQDASIQKDQKLLSSIDAGPLKDLAKIQSAFLLKENHKNKEANEILQSIPDASGLKEIAKMLLHYQN
ncbi:hypothetical protein [Helicobacter mustelae]|uniref:50S ribosomal protein L22 n=1 Tax=Helicobacter mustelae (strain ATCC 43772 / CCUG 25715 / CIP 103759 / LMG 18044 / NCTC 12198 / R85-136P) TaxID=679897 RepID=D3UI36_HELM1|nr:hypothetical protein [Helicobacter mustelae]CBG40159.1 putative hypothetical protein [Helicobacter mustelae 12198]SQH71661.1 50S ribosomal protein L22 [Helicobacter mustelae]